MAETVRLTIDGIEVEVEKGASVIEAAHRAGIGVPHYCYHPGLKVAGNCRMCLVKIEKMPKLVTSCTTLAGDGMVVETRADEVKEAVAGVEEFLLANHPLDCPICDQAGECRLQQYSFRHGKVESRFREERMKFKKGVEIGPHVILDSERCIVCTRCVRFCDEISKTGELGVFQRGLHSEIGIFPGRELENAYSGNVVDLCPVGALTLKEFRFRKRVWYIRDVPSVCGSCASGCNVNLGIAQNRLWRLTPRENREVNGWWMCDEGRLSYEELQARTRTARAEVRDGSAFEPAGMGDAVRKAAALLAAAPEGSAAVIASGNLTVEDLWLLKRLQEAVAGLRAVVPQRHRGEDDGFLIRADKTANRKGAELLGLDIDAGGAASRALMEEVASGKVKTVLSLGEEISTLAGGETALEALDRSGSLITVGPFQAASSAASSLRIPAAAYGEAEGTWVNYRGRAQRVRRGITPRVAALPYWKILSLLLAELGVEISFDSAAQILRQVAETVPAFQGLSWTALGAEGRALNPGKGVPEQSPPPGAMPRPAWVSHA